MTPARQRSAVTLDDRLGALDEAAELADGRLDAAVVAAAREVVRRGGVRRGLSVGHTVVALAGATGSGKSSLFNALAGAEVAKVGVTRPTTDRAQAVVWDPAGAGPLLDWLRVPRRHVVSPSPDDAADADTGAEQGPSGLILLDLPDHDSIEASHRLEVNRLVGLVDLLVWVLDPQKYADAAVHERYLRPLARHQDVTVVVLNQIDRLPAQAVGPCVSDLRRLLAEDGLDGVRLVAASARTGAGLPDLRWMLAASVSRRRAWADRLAADAALAANALHRESGSPPASPSAEWWELASAVPGEHERPGDGRRTGRALDMNALAAPLTTALSDAAGVPLVVEAVAKAHRHRSVVATGWPFTRWIRRLRPDPLRRLRLAADAGDRRLAPSGRRSLDASRDAPERVTVSRSDDTARARRGAPFPVRVAEGARRNGRTTGEPSSPAAGRGGTAERTETSRTTGEPSGGPGHPRGSANDGGTERTTASRTTGEPSSAPGVAYGSERDGGTERTTASRTTDAPSSAPRPAHGSRRHGGTASPASGAPSGGVVDRTSLPTASAMQRSRVETAIRDVAQQAAEGLPAPWAAAVRRAAVSRKAEIPDALDRAVATGWGDARPPRWWRVVGAWQWLLLGVVAVGLLWLLVLAGFDYLRLPEPPLPTLGELPWPTVLLLGGIAAGLVTALLSRAAAWAGGRRRARRTARRLRASVDRVGRDLILAPVAAELDRHRRFTRRIDTARAG